jgi:hypothetical protein
MKKLLFFLFLLITYSSYAQKKAYVQLSVHTQSLPTVRADVTNLESSGKQTSVTSLFLNASLPLSPSSFPYTVTNNNMMIIFSEDSKINLTATVNCRYYRWWVGGDNQNDSEYSQSISVENAITFASNGTQNPAKTFVTFPNIPLDPVWTLSYSVASVSPFQPVIKDDRNKHCYDIPFDISVDINTPNNLRAPNVNNTFEWEFGEMGIQYTENSNFQSALFQITEDLKLNAIANYPAYNSASVSASFSNGNYESFKGVRITTVEQFAEKMVEWYATYGINDHTVSASDKEFVMNNLYFAALVERFSENYCNPYTETSAVIWRPLNATMNPLNRDTISLSLDPKTLYTSFTEPKQVHFRVRAIRGGEYGPWSNPKVLDILPPAPSMDVSVVEKSCPSQKTGIIKMDNISGVDVTNKYMYRYGRVCANDRLNSIDQLKPTVSANDTSSCGWTALPISFTGTSLSISEVPAGRLQVYLTYWDSTIRNCFSAKNVKTISVPAFDSLKVETTFTDITCPDETDGTIEATVTSGAGNYEFGLSGSSDLTGVDSSKTSSPTATATYTKLTAGNYTVKVKDKCQDTHNQSFTITKPSPIEIDNISGVSDPTCVNEPNGSIDSLICRGGSGTYIYKIDDGAFVFQQQWDNLPEGAYKITVWDAEHTTCPGKEASFILNGVSPLEIEADKVFSSPVNCFGDANGSLSVTGGKGGSGDYQYILLNKENNLSYQPPQSTLIAGNYLLRLRNNDDCSDRATMDITISSPPELTASATGVDVTCFGENDGKISHQIEGGTGARTLEWAYWIGDWIPVNTGFALEELKPASYRLVVKDANNCRDTSNTVSILEPDLLTGEAFVEDIHCFGEKGRIHQSATGGNSGYIFQYDNGTGVGFVNFPSDNMFPVGQYAVRVVDSKNCVAILGEELTITAPEKPLDFSYTISDYNGYQISCYGNHDGWITVSPFGGNSGEYSGYKYTVKDRVQTDNDTIFSLLPADDYTIIVRDARECSVSKGIQITQPESSLVFNSPEIAPVTCHYDRTGRISLFAAGGTTPYSYSINEDAFVGNHIFDRLGAGTFNFSVRDQNGCTWSERFTVIHTAPKIEIDAFIRHVNCFGGNDGYITPTISGGKEPLSYLWPDLQIVEKNITGLYRGSYKLLTTDAAGCVDEQTFEVGQPAAALSLSAYAKPLCAGSQYGLIRPTAHYGTPPYLYAVGQSSGFSATNEFPLSPGIHQVYAQDANNCVCLTTTEIEVKNNMPAVNFMAATSRYALDTLVLKDVSLPKPDSIRWLWPVEMHFVAGTEFEPIVTTQYPGWFEVEMTGWFAGCDYSVSKILQFAEFDPESVEKDINMTGIKNVELYPNPNEGQFKIKIELYVKQKVLLNVNDINGVEHYNKPFVACMELEDEIDLSSAISGIYLLTIIADNDIRSIRFVIQK